MKGKTNLLDLTQKSIKLQAFKKAHTEKEGCDDKLYISSSSDSWPPRDTMTGA